MKKMILMSILLLTQCFATHAQTHKNGGAVVAGGRLTALADSYHRMQAAMDTITDLTVKISSVKIIDQNQVKIELMSTQDGLCRAIVYEVQNEAGASDQINYVASNPQRALCD